MNVGRMEANHGAEVQRFADDLCHYPRVVLIFFTRQPSNKRVLNLIYQLTTFMNPT